MQENWRTGEIIVILSTFKFANQVLITFLTVRHLTYAMPDFNQAQQKLELIFLRFFFLFTLLVSNQSAMGNIVLIRDRGSTRSDAKIANRPTKRSGNNVGSHCLSQITANIDNPVARDTTTKTHVDIRETRRDEMKRNETKRDARRGTMGKSEESPEERVSADRYITGKARPR